MIKCYSQRLSPPYSGQVQIAESERGRAVTVDGEMWEFHFLHARSNGHQWGNAKKAERHFRRIAYIHQSDLGKIAEQATQDGQPVDDRILELAEFLTTANLPFPAVDRYEYWLLDAEDKSPLALIFSCSEESEMSTYPPKNEWTALPASVMPIEKTPEELENSALPVNYRFEQAVMERAGYYPKTRWFTRHSNESDNFPPFLVREDWNDEATHQLCQRYLQRQSTRLLMLHGLTHGDRQRMEQAAKAHATEVQRFYPLYPEVADEKLMNAIRVEARLKNAVTDERSVHKRRDGLLYI